MKQKVLKVATAYSESKDGSSCGCFVDKGTIESARINSEGHLSSSSSELPRYLDGGGGHNLKTSHLIIGRERVLLDSCKHQPRPAPQPAIRRSFSREKIAELLRLAAPFICALPPSLATGLPIPNPSSPRFQTLSVSPPIWTPSARTRTPPATPIHPCELAYWFFATARKWLRKIAIAVVGFAKLPFTTLAARLFCHLVILIHLPLLFPFTATRMDYCVPGALSFPLVGPWTADHERSYPLARLARGLLVSLVAGDARHRRPPRRPAKEEKVPSQV